MSKPSWSDPSCPPWANYLAMDIDGDWFWFENKPNARHSGWWGSGGECCRAGISNWRDTLEERPVHNEHEAEGK